MYIIKVGCKLSQSDERARYREVRDESKLISIIFESWWRKKTGSQGSQGQTFRVST